jgi:hypothetical protein
VESGSASGGSATTLAKYCARAISRRSGATVGPCIGIERSSLQGVLVAGIEGVPRRLGTSIRSLTQHKECVAVDFTDGRPKLRPGCERGWDLVDCTRAHAEWDGADLHRRNGVAQRRANPTARPNQSAIFAR